MNAAVDTEQARVLMIEQQIRPWDVLDTEVLQTLRQVPREHYVPRQYKGLAFVDCELPLTQPTRPGQCMLPPRVEARMLQDLQIQPSDKVLEIGTGSGYMAALLAHRARQVLTVEIDPALAQLATQTLAREEVANVAVITGNGALSVAWQAHAPFDVIVLSGSVAHIPDNLMQALTPGGRLGAVVGQLPMMQFVVAKASAGRAAATPRWDTVLPRLQGFDEPSTFTF